MLYANSCTTLSIPLLLGLPTLRSSDVLAVCNRLASSVDAPGHTQERASSRCRVCWVLMMLSLAGSRKGATLARLEARSTWKGQKEERAGQGVLCQFTFEEMKGNNQLTSAGNYGVSTRGLLGHTNFTVSSLPVSRTCTVSGTHFVKPLSDHTLNSTSRSSASTLGLKRLASTSAARAEAARH